MAVYSSNHLLYLNRYLGVKPWAYSTDKVNLFEPRVWHTLLSLGDPYQAVALARAEPQFKHCILRLALLLLVSHRQ